MRFTERNVTVMHVKLNVIRKRVRKLILVREITSYHQLDQMIHLRLRVKLATCRRNNGFDRIEVQDEWWQQRSQAHACSVEDPKHFDFRRLPTPREFTEILGAEVNVLKQEVMPLQPPPQQPYPAVSTVVTVKRTTVELSVEEVIPFDVGVYLKKTIEGRIKSEKIAVESSSTGYGSRSTRTAASLKLRDETNYSRRLFTRQ